MGEPSPACFSRNATACSEWFPVPGAIPRISSSTKCELYRAPVVIRETDERKTFSFIPTG